MTNFTAKAQIINRQDPRDILRRLDGRCFIFPQRRELGVLTARIDMDALMLHLHDVDGNFVGCYLTYQIPYIGSSKFNHAIREVREPGQ